MYKNIKILVLTIIIFLLITSGAFASEINGTVPVDSYAWGENIGWINFGASSGNVHITDSAVTGYAWSSTHGWINLSPGSGGVTNTCTGQLGGYAWSSALGWITFSGVTINSSGRFTGIAGTTGSTAGRINFDCGNCNVTTDWRQCALRTTPTPTPSSSNTSTTTTSSTSADSQTTTSPTPTPGFITRIVRQLTGQEAPSPSLIPRTPTQLFDIALVIDDPLIEDSRNLSARVTLTSFGTEDTPVDMEFIVLDDTGKELYTTSGKTVIQTEGIYNQTFKDLVIPDGKYTLTLKTLYGDNVGDEFRQSFEVRAACIGLVCVVCNQVRWAIPLELMLIVLLIIRKLRRKEIFHA